MARMTGNRGRAQEGRTEKGWLRIRYAGAQEVAYGPPRSTFSPTDELCAVEKALGACGSQGNVQRESNLLLSPDPSHHNLGGDQSMGSTFNGGPASQNDAKEYARFCRIRGLFLVDGLELWRTALKARGFPEEEIRTKVSAATDFVRRMEEPSSELRGA